MNAKTTIGVRQDMMDLIVASAKPEKREAVKDLILALNELVNLIESSPQTTKGWYGNYIEHCGTIEKCGLLLAAGANMGGIRGAAMVNGLV